MRAESTAGLFSRIRGVIFDLDGTLLDSSWLWEAVDRRFFARRGLEMPPDYAQAIHAMELRQMAEYTIQRFSLPQEPQELMDEWNADALRTYAEEVTLKPGARELLSLLLQKKLPLGIATSCQREMFLPALRKNGVEALFSACVTTHEVGAGKDDPEVYLSAARQMRLLPMDCMVIEDSPHGAATAQKAGFFTVGIYDRSPWDRSAELRACCDLYITDFFELIELLGQPNTQRRSL